MTAMSFWYLNTTMIVRLNALVDQDGAAITDATVEMTECVDFAGNTPSGLTLPLTLVHQTGGTYEATLDDEIVIELGTVLLAKIVATESGGATREWTEKLVPKRSEG